MIYNKLKSVFHNKLLANITVLLSGNVLSQIILFISTPYLSRIYNPTDFGVTSIFTSLTTILALFTTGRYEFSILTQKKSVGISLSLVLILSFIVSILILVLLPYILRINQINSFVLLHDLSFNYLLVPFFILIIGWSTGFQYYIQNKKNYKTLSFVAIIQTLINVLLAVLFNYLDIKHGLIYSLILSQCFSCLSIFAFVRFKYNFKITFDMQELVQYAKDNINYPKYLLMSDLSLVLNQQLTSILFGIMYNLEIVGFISIAIRLLKLPNILISSSISSVLRIEFAELKSLGNNMALSNLFNKVFKKLVLYSLPFFIIGYFVMPYIITMYFGNRWELAGIYSQALIILIYFEFISSCINSVFYILDNQKIYMRLQIFRMVIGSFVILLLGKIGTEVLYVLYVYSIIDSLVSVFQIYKAYSIINGNYKL